MGLGLLGRGVGDAEFLAPLVKELIVTDLKSEQELITSVGQLKGFSNIVFHLGEHKLEDFQNRDLIIKAAGVPLNSPFVAEAKKNGVLVRMSADLFAQFATIPIVGVTGTRGKSTVAHMIAHVLKTAGRKVLLGGNVRGVSTLALLKDVTPDTVAVLELDSWQLQGFGEAKISPNVAVFTNLLSDHLNYYKDNPEQYFTDKTNIFKYQKPGDVLVVGAQVEQHIRAANPPVVSTVPALGNWHLNVLGEHNEENAACAAEAARALGVTEEQIKTGLESFEQIEGRLQLVREVRGVKIYNDNNATTPEATIAALKAFEPSKTILIAGGADKGLETEVLVAEIKKCKKVLLLAGTGTDKVKNDLRNTTMYRSVSGAMQDAVKTASAGDIILFSPAFASFGMFKNEYDRGGQFMKAVEALS